MHGSNLEAKASSHRRRRLLASTAILWAICCSAPAQANDECGTGTVVLCDHGDQEYFNDFDTGITYDPVADLTLIVGRSATIAPTSNHGIHILDSDAIDITLQDGARIITPTDKMGISVVYAGDVAITLSGASSIVTNGRGAMGINVAYTGGETRLYALGSIETSGETAHAVALYYNDGDVTLVTAGTLTTQGWRAHGAYIANTNGNVSVQSAAAITTHGDAAKGIAVAAITDADISITHSGAITTSGVDAHGIYVFEFLAAPIVGSDVTVATTLGSSIVTYGSNADGIRIDSAPSKFIADVTLDLAGAIDAQGTDSNGIFVKDALGSITIDISGSVSGGTGDGAAIRILGDSPVTIDNTGTIKGAVIMGNGDDSFTNAGSLYTDEVDMGGGSDTLVNNGTIWLSSTAGTIANVESFTHSGLIDLANGTVGDTLSISGEFVSAGGSLYLDASLDSGTADLLTLHTVAASSNPTLIHVTGIGSGPTTAPILLVDADSDASNGNAFTLATNTIGAYEYELAYDAAAATWYLPLPSIFSGAAEYPALVSGALLAFASDLPALHERLRESFGDGKDRIEPAAWRGASQRLRPWVQLDTSRQDISSAAAYDLDVTKIETGLDARTSVAGSLYAFGAFAGAGRSLQKFHGSSSEADADTLTAGLYGAYRSGPFQARGIVKYEHQALAYSSDAADDGLGLNLLGLSLEAAYRLERGTAYLEPRVGLSYAHAWAGSFADASGAAIDLDDADSLSGELAARWGLAAFHLDLALRHEVSGRTSAEVSGLTFSDELPGTVIRMASGLDWSLLDGMVNVSLDAGYAKGNDAEELSATAALRFSY